MLSRVQSIQADLVEVGEKNSLEKEELAPAQLDLRDAALRHS